MMMMMHQRLEVIPVDTSNTNISCFQELLRPVVNSWIIQPYVQQIQLRKVQLRHYFSCMAP